MELLNCDVSFAVQYILLSANHFTMNQPKRQSFTSIGLNKSTACWCQHFAVGCLIEDKKSSKKGHNLKKKKCILNCLP